MSTLLGAAGSAATARMLSDAGIDRVIAYHSSVYRSFGISSVAGLLPWASANEQTLDMLPAVLEGAGPVPVLATVCANDGILPRAEMLARLRAAGAAGVLNAPTVGLLEGAVRSVLETEGLGHDTEIDLIAQSRGLGLESWAYVFDPEWTALALRAGATGVIVHLGITGYPTQPDLVGCLRVAQELGAPHVMVHGGDLRAPADLRALLASLPSDLAATITGFMGASAFERAADPGTAVMEWRNAVEPATTRSEQNDG